MKSNIFLKWHKLIGNKRCKEELARTFNDNNSPMKITIAADIRLAGSDVS